VGPGAEVGNKYLVPLPGFARSLLAVSASPSTLKIVKSRRIKHILHGG